MGGDGGGVIELQPNKVASTTGLLLLCFIAVNFHHKFHPVWISEPAVIALTGFFVGGIAYASKQYTATGAFAFDEFLFHYFVLPAIVFNYGYNTRFRFMFQNALPSVLFALLSTLLTLSFLLGTLYVVYPQVTSKDWKRPGDEGYFHIIGALAICLTAADAAPMMSVLSEVFRLGDAICPPPLYLFLMVEGLFSNVMMLDGFDALKRQSTSLHPGMIILLWSLEVLYAAVLSLLLGLVYGFAFTIFLRFVPMHGNYFLELVCVLSVAFGSYYCTDFISYKANINMDPMVSCFVTAVVIGTSTWYNMGVFTRASFPTIVKSAAFAAEVYTHALLGSTFWDLIRSGGNFHIGLSLACLGLMYAARVVVLPVAMLAKRFLRTPAHLSYYIPEEFLPQLSPEEKHRITQRFVQMDTDRSSYISFEEMPSLLMDLGYIKSKKKLDRLFQLVDDDGTNELDLSEFILLVRRLKYKPPKEGVTRHLLCGVFWGGMRGHIAYGLALTASHTPKFTDKVSVSSIVWLSVAVTVLLQGSLAELFMIVTGMIPPRSKRGHGHGHEHGHHSDHTENIESENHVHENHHHVEFMEDTPQKNLEKEYLPEKEDPTKTSKISQIWHYIHSPEVLDFKRIAFQAHVGTVLEKSDETFRKKMNKDYQRHLEMYYVAAATLMESEGVELEEFDDFSINDLSINERDNIEPHSAHHHYDYDTHHHHTNEYL